MNETIEIYWKGPIRESSWLRIMFGIDSFPRENLLVVLGQWGEFLLRHDKTEWMLHTTVFLAVPWGWCGSGGYSLAVPVVATWAAVARICLFPPELKATASFAGAAGVNGLHIFSCRDSQAGGWVWDADALTERRRWFKEICQAANCSGWRSGTRLFLLLLSLEVGDSCQWGLLKSQYLNTAELRVTPEPGWSIDDTVFPVISK